MEKDADGQIKEDEREAKIKELDPDVAQVMGLVSHRQAALMEQDSE